MEKILDNFIGLNPKINFEDDKKSSCPKIILPGWWWKKYFPSYRKLQIIMQDVTTHYWMNGGYEEQQKYIKDMLNMMIDMQTLSTFDYGFKTHEKRS